MEALSDVVRQGKARYIGFSEWSARADRGRRRDARRRAVRLQPAAVFAALAAAGGEGHPVCAANGISQIVWSPLAQGVLSGKYRPGAPPAADTRASSDSMGGMMQNWLRPEILEAVQQLMPLAAEGRLHALAVLARLGAARTERRLGHRRRQPAGAAGGERRRVGNDDRPRPVPPSGGRGRRCRAGELRKSRKDFLFPPWGKYRRSREGG